MKTSSEEKENNKMNKNPNKETHPCVMVPCSALKSSLIRHQPYTWRSDINPTYGDWATPPSQPWDRSCCGLWCCAWQASAQPLSSTSAQNQVILPEDVSSCHDILIFPLPIFLWNIFFPILKKNAQRQFCWSLREKHNTGGNLGQEEMEESHALHRNRRLWT